MIWPPTLDPAQSGQSSCSFGGTLRRVSDQGLVESVANTVLTRREATSRSGETQIYGVTAAPHFLEMSSTGCDWTVTLTLQ